MIKAPNDAKQTSQTEMHEVIAPRKANLALKSLQVKQNISTELDLNYPADDDEPVSGGV